MKKVGLLVSAVLLNLVFCSTIFASTTISTIPTQPVLVDGPFVITAYSFSGHNLRYVQLSNVSKNLAVLDGWKLRVSWSGGFWEVGGLSGVVAPGKKVLVAEKSVVPNAAFTFTTSGVAADPTPELLSLVPPATGLYNNHLVDTTVKTSTIRDSTTQPATFYLQRNVSSSTGDFLSTFTALSNQPLTLEADPLYVAPLSSPLQVVEVYPNAPTCSVETVGPLCYDYVKLFNASTSQVSLGNFRLWAGNILSASTTALQGELTSGQYVVVRVTLNDTGGNVWLEDAYGSVVYEDSNLAYPSGSDREGSAWSYDSTSDGWRWTTSPTPVNEPNDFGPVVKINDCAGVKLSEIGANYDPQFIEIYNSTSEEVDLSGCQLQTNRSLTAYYAFPSGTKFDAGQYLATSVEAAKLTLTKTTSGTVYLLSSDGQTEVNSRSYENLDDNTSLALVDGVWRQTFSVTVGAQNVYQQYPSCEAGYVRNESTGLCNKIVVAEPLAPCAVDEYRSTETNRCRKLVTTAAASLVPCGEGQERNPATNRCRSIASAVVELLPCDEGYERNPATNRCRKVAGVATTAAVTPASLVEQAKGSEWSAWTWALVAVGAAGAVGYGVYEWRSELFGLTHKIAAKLGKK